jgi:cyclohexa-1,5-dienecarbonyl-CoA hydratase
MTQWNLKQDDLDKVEFRLGDDGAILWVVLNDPPGNVLDAKMMGSLRRLVAAGRQVPTLRLIVFSGAGEQFSYGASVEEHVPDRVGGMLEIFHGLFRDLIDSDLPAAALVRGRCLGGGLELAAFCDRVVVEEGAVLGLPEIKLGVFPPIGSLLLPWRCGARGSGLALTGATVDATEAARIGLADELVPKGEGQAAVERWFRKALLPLSASSLRHARRASRWSFHKMIREELGAVETLYLDDLMKTHDGVEGIKAFLEKRKPEWTHG